MRIDMPQGAYLFYWAWLPSLVPRSSYGFLGRLRSSFLDVSCKGLASAVVWVTGLAMIADTVKGFETEEFPSRLIAPLLGGVILAKAGYHAVFGLTLGIYRHQYYSASACWREGSCYVLAC